MAIDSHTHINSYLVPKYFNSIDEEIKRINNDKNLSYVINVGLDIKTSKDSIHISNNNDKFYSSIGIHPLYITNNNVDELYKLVTDKVVAIGEIGLDLCKDNRNYSEQKKHFISQIEIANDLHLPVIIHSNNANREVIEVFEEYLKPKYGCVFHCYQPDIEYIDYIIDNGFYISFAGRITYKTAKKSIEVLNRIPDYLYMIETDSPYISPEPIRDSVGYSGNIKYIIEKISKIKDISYEEVERQSDQNIKRLFKIK